MALPLLFMLGTTVLRAAGPTIAKELTKLGARKLSQSAIKKGGQSLIKNAKPVNSNNLGTIRTVARPKSGGGATSQTATKATPKTSPKTSGTTAAKPKAKPTSGAAKKKAPELKADPKAAPSSVKARTAQKAKDAKPSALGTKTQRRMLGAAATAASLVPLLDKEPKNKAEATPKPDMSNRANSQGGRKRGEGAAQPSKGDSFREKFKDVYAGGKGRGKKFTWQGKEYVAVTSEDVKKAGAENLADYLKKKSGMAKGGYASKNRMGANDYRMGGMLVSVDDRRKMK